MKLLKIKGKFYQYTGWYLGSKEELEHINSEEFWKELYKIYKNPENDMGLRSIHGLLVGSWQAGFGFHRRYDSKYGFLSENQTWITKVWSWLRVFYWTLTDDLQRLIK